MGRNNQQRRKAKAKGRARHRSRARTEEEAQGWPGDPGARTQGWPGVGGWARPGNGTGTHDAAADSETDLLWVRRWRRMTAEGRAQEAATAEFEVLGVLGSPVRRAALTAYLTDWLLGGVELAWKGGWEPADLLRSAERRLAPGAVAAVRDAMSLSLSRYAAATVSARWHHQLREAGVTVWWPRADTPLSARLRTATQGDAVELLADTVDAADLLEALPVLQRLDAPPGQWRAPAGGARTGPAPETKLLERVRALLAKAENTPFEAEAETFTAAAQSLMARHSIDRAMLAAANPGEQTETPIARRVGVDRPYEAPKAALLSSVASANRCRTAWSQNLGFTTVVGFADDVTATETLFTSLLLQATRTMTGHGSHRGPAGRSGTRSFRQSFLLAYATCIGQRLMEATQHEVDAREAAGTDRSARSTARPGTELVAVLNARSEEVDRTLADLFPNMVDKSIGSVTNAEGWAAGTHAADTATLFDELALPAR